MKPARPSNTARVVALGTAFIAARPHLLGAVPRAALPWLDAFIGHCGWRDRALLWAARKAWFGPIASAIEWLTVPGLFLHFALRKRVIEQTVRQTHASGVRQFINLGAGLDTLFWRLAEEAPPSATAVPAVPAVPDAPAAPDPSTAYWEIDHPATQSIKRRCTSAPPALTLSALDLRHMSLARTLPALPRYRSSDAVCIVCEGLSMYLREDEIRSLLVTLAAQAAPGSALIFSFLELDAAGKPNFRSARRGTQAWLHLRSESFTWGISANAAGGFLASCGWRLQQCLQPADEWPATALALGLDTLPPRLIARGEYLAIARRI